MYCLMIALALLCGCAATSGGSSSTNNAATNAVAAVALLPFKIVGALVGAAIGVASGMGMMEEFYGKSN